VNRRSRYAQNVAAWSVGVAAAVRAPRWLAGRRLSTLMAESVSHGRRTPAVVRARYASRLTLRLLSRVPLSPWRNTCLFRSAADCLVLRHYGVGARLRIGVRQGRGNESGVLAHAWIESGARRASDYVALDRR
jgi:hypothetical protein